MRLCIFSGSNPGNDPAYAAAAHELGERLAQAGIGIVYGGAAVGLMGVLADAALAAGGEVIGVLPRALYEKEIAHDGLTELRIVGSMHERKATMAELADGFVALPGGIGTLEELFEMWTWGQLGEHEKPCALYDAGGFYAGLEAWLDEVVAAGFIRPAHRSMLIVARSVDELLAAIERYEAPHVGKWVERGAT